MLCVLKKYSTRAVRVDSTRTTWYVQYHFACYVQYVGILTYCILSMGRDGYWMPYWQLGCHAILCEEDKKEGLCDIKNHIHTATAHHTCTVHVLQLMILTVGIKHEIIFDISLFSLLFHCWETDVFAAFHPDFELSMGVWKSQKNLSKKSLGCHRQ